jgi:hypothetical protein
MARGTTEMRSDTKPAADEMKSAYDAAMAFPVEQVNSLRATPEQLMGKASE